VFSYGVSCARVDNSAFVTHEESSLRQLMPFCSRRFVARVALGPRYSRSAMPREFPRCGTGALSLDRIHHNTLAALISLPDSQRIRKRKGPSTPAMALIRFGCSGDQSLLFTQSYFLELNGSCQRKGRLLQMGSNFNKNASCKPSPQSLVRRRQAAALHSQWKHCSGCWHSSPSQTGDLNMSIREL
jgi:hypothetical protein